MDDITKRLKSLSTDEAIVGGNAYTVAGERSTIEEIISNYGSEIIGGFHETIDEDGEMGICYIRTPEAKLKKDRMLEKFREEKILVWREKEVNQSTNGYELNLAIKEHLQFAKDNKDIIRFSGSPEIEINIEKSIYPEKISYTVPKGCRLKPDGSKPVGLPNKYKMGVKIDTIQDPKKNYNKEISTYILNKILDQHHEKTVLPKREFKRK